VRAEELVSRVTGIRELARNAPDREVPQSGVGHVCAKIDTRLLLACLRVTRHRVESATTAKGIKRR